MIAKTAMSVVLRRETPSSAPSARCLVVVMSQWAGHVMLRHPSPTPARRASVMAAAWNVLSHVRSPVTVSRKARELPVVASLSTEKPSKPASSKCTHFLPVVLGVNPVSSPAIPSPHDFLLHIIFQQSTHLLQTTFSDRLMGIGWGCLHVLLAGL